MHHDRAAHNSTRDFFCPLHVEIFKWCVLGLIVALTIFTLSRTTFANQLSSNFNQTQPEENL